MHILSFATHIHVGNHLDSLVSVPKKITSCSSINVSNCLILSLASNSLLLFALYPCPGIGIVMIIPFDRIPGKICFNAFAAAVDLYVEVLQSSNVNSD